MKRILLTPGLALLSFVFSASAALQIEYSQPRRPEDTSFVRLSDLFGNGGSSLPESDPTRFVVLSNPAERHGLFFEVELNEAVSKIPEGTVARVEILIDSDRVPRNFNFPLPANTLRARARFIWVLPRDRLRGPRGHPHILAWKISLLDAGGKEISAFVSPLWQK